MESRTCTEQKYCLVRVKRLKKHLGGASQVKNSESRCSSAEPGDVLGGHVGGDHQLGEGRSQSDGELLEAGPLDLRHSAVVEDKARERGAEEEQVSEGGD